METLLPVLITKGCHKRGMPLASVARVVSQNPARIMGRKSAFPKQLEPTARGGSHFGLDCPPEPSIAGE
jgi:dihydroorotase-like cyclic amidohydrolase